MTPGTEELSTEMGTLADRCEQATAGDRRLDCSIAEAALGWRECWGMSGERYMGDTPEGKRREVPRFTSSLEAAIKLVPDGWWWSIGECSVSCDATVGPDVAYCDKATLIRFDAGISCDLPNPSTPALALCAAALRARAQANCPTSDSKDARR